MNQGLRMAREQEMTANYCTCLGPLTASEFWQSHFEVLGIIFFYFSIWHYMPCSRFRGQDVDFLGSPDHQNYRKISHRLLEGDAREQRCSGDIRKYHNDQQHRCNWVAAINLANHEASRIESGTVKTRNEVECPCQKACAYAAVEPS